LLKTKESSGWAGLVLDLLPAAYKPAVFLAYYFILMRINIWTRIVLPLHNP
jgi:hypothetical protein